MSFPFFQSPGTIVFLDDDRDYLDMLALVLPKHWHVRLFLRPQECINQLQQEPPLWEADAWAQQQLIDQWREGGTALIPQILRYWAQQTGRYALAQVCVVDYSMPGMDGLQALSELVDWPGLRILLTGQADEQVAVDAFNRGLIEQFIPKQTPDISRRLIDAVHRLQATASGRHSQMWRTTLSQKQNALLRIPSVAKGLTDVVAGRWADYVVIGDPFGILGRDANGRVGWLQLEPADGLDELADLAASAGVSAEQLAEIRQGRKLVNLELAQALARGTPPELSAAFPIGADAPLLGALFSVTDGHAPDQGGGYTGWLVQQQRRTVQD